MLAVGPGCSDPLTLTACGVLYHSVRLESSTGHAIFSGKSELCRSKLMMATRCWPYSPASTSGPLAELTSVSAHGVSVIVLKARILTSLTFRKRVRGSSGLTVRLRAFCWSAPILNIAELPGASEGGLTISILAFGNCGGR